MGKNMLPSVKRNGEFLTLQNSARWRNPSSNNNDNLQKRHQNVVTRIKVRHTVKKSANITHRYTSLLNEYLQQDVLAKPWFCHGARHLRSAPHLRIYILIECRPRRTNAKTKSQLRPKPMHENHRLTRTVKTDYYQNKKDIGKGRMPNIPYAEVRKGEEIEGLSC